MLHPDGAADPELAALGLMNLGVAESWTWRLTEAEQHLEQGLALARRLGRPYLELGCLGALGGVANLTGRLDLAEDHLRQSIAIAERVGWSTHALVGVSCMTLASVLIERGRLTEGERRLEQAEPILMQAPEPPATVGLRHGQGMLWMVRGRFAEALAAYRDGERLADQLRAPHFLAVIERQWQLRASLRLGDLEPPRAALASADAGAQWCSLAAHLCLAEDDPEGAVAAVAPVLAGTAFAAHVNMEIEAVLLDGVARMRLDQPEAAARRAARALALSEPQGRAFIALTVPGVRELLERHPLHRTAHAAQLKALLDLLGGVEPPRAEPDELPEPLSERELAVLRFLPTNLTAAEMGSELFLSVHTVKTHMRKLYAKLDVHARAEAVQRGRALGLLAPARRGS
jgi:LuxR family maltose regulon positive regulatory protein